MWDCPTSIFNQVITLNNGGSLSLLGGDGFDNNQVQVKSAGSQQLTVDGGIMIFGGGTGTLNNVLIEAATTQTIAVNSGFLVYGGSSGVNNDTRIRALGGLQDINVAGGFQILGGFGGNDNGAFIKGDQGAQITADFIAINGGMGIGNEAEIDTRNALQTITATDGILLQGELWCEGTIAGPDLEPRGPMTSAQLMDSAITRLTKANDVAKSLTGTEASSIATAALVGIARAHLNAGRKAQASQFAAQVPASFTYNLLHLDDPSNRGRLGNTIWSFSEARISLVTGPEYRAMADAGDKRIAYTDMKRVAQDGQLNFFRQAKITGWGTADRLASGLEAQYIKIEADADPAAMFAFIYTRRAAGNPSASQTIWNDNNAMAAPYAPHN